METYGDLGIAHFNNPAPAFTVVTAHIWKSVYLGVRVGVQDPGSGLQPTYNWDIEPYIACIYIYISYYIHTYIYIYIIGM